ncbi:MAG: cation diffusion facilitator family transporter, partial [Planctomycetota bacterium]
MTTETLQSDNAAIRRVTFIGMAGNTLLAVLKMLVGGLAGSMALVADGIHSLSDCLTDIAVILGVHLGSKKPDPEHPYGHGRLETFSTAFIAIILIVVGGGMIYKASIAIARTHGISDEVTMSSAVIWVAMLSVLVKEALYQWTRIVAVKTHSTALYANAWHHRSDALSSIAVVIGAVAVKLGYPYGDQLAAIAVGLMVIMVGVKVFGGCLHEFSERAVDEQ